MKDYRTCITLNPNKREVYDNMGLVVYNLGDFKAATDYFTKAIKADSTHGIAYYYRGYTEIETKEKDKACEDFQKAKKYNYEKAHEAIDKKCK